MNRNNAKSIQSEVLSQVMEAIELDDIKSSDSSHILPAPINQPAGGVLREARVAKNISLQDVSKHLRISVKQIQALENDNFSTLPESVIVRGFIRNYARMLGVNAEPILDAYKLQSPEVVQGFTMQSSINMPINSKDKQSWVKYIVASAFVVVGLGIWLFYSNLMGASLKFGQVTRSLAPETTAVVMPATEPLPEIALPAAERAAQTEQPMPVVQTEQPVPSIVGADAESKVAVPVANSSSATVQPATQAELVVATTTKAVAPVSTIAATKLNFSAKEETWLNITDANGKVIYSKVLAAGTQDSLQAQAVLPIKVIVGNIHGTTFNYNDNPVDLSSYAKVNVARFSLK